MSRLEPAETIEAIVGAHRDATEHIGRAVSAEQRVYILHSQECVDSGADLRECEFSISLDGGIDPDIWRDMEDQPFWLVIDDDFGDLIPARAVGICRDCSEAKHGACIGSTFVENGPDIDEVECRCPDATHAREER